MSKKPPNEPIGTCPCPFRNCELEAQVYRFRSDSEGSAKSRFAGKLYLMCPTHRRSEDQEWILEHATIDPGAQVARVDEIAPPPAKPAEPEPAANDDDNGGFGFFR